jgi:hypothetical protein
VTSLLNFGDQTSTGGFTVAWLWAFVVETLFINYVWTHRNFRKLRNIVYVLWR